LKTIVLLTIGAGLLLAGYQASAQELLATTNKGELVRVDMVQGQATLIGDAGRLAGKTADVGWTGLSFDALGDLYAVSRQSTEPPTGCPGSPLSTKSACAHLYRIDPNTGAVLAEQGNTQTPFLSDIDFAASGALYGNQWDSKGTLLTVNPAVGTATIVNHFGTKLDPFGVSIDLQNGGLSVDPTSGELWAVESGFGTIDGGNPSIFKVDPATGTLIPPVVAMGLVGEPITFGFDSLEILPDGRFIATRGGARDDIYEINPVPDPVSGLAEVRLIMLARDPLIKGNLNGLEFLQTSAGFVTSLTNDVINLGLPAGTAQNLTKKLAEVQKKLNKGELDKAREKICKFVKELNKAVAVGDIAPADANKLLKKAGILLGSLTY